MQVIGTLLPPPPARPPRDPDPAPSAAGTGAPSGPGTTLNGQQEIVILAVTAQQAEVIKFAQMDGNVTLALRVGRRLHRPGHRRAVLPPVAAETTGVILKILVDTYGVLPPEVVETVTPTATKK